jgi:Zn-dependent oligopeptidase
MEHWLREKSTIQALIKMSLTIADDELVEDDAIDAFYRIQGMEKAHKINEVVYHSALELYLFSKFDVRGSESMIQAQQRLAHEYRPHELSSYTDDIASLVEIFQSNAMGQHISIYRYLWCDCLAAVVFHRLKEDYMQASSINNNVDSDNTMKTTSGVSSPSSPSLVELRNRIRQTLLSPGGSIDINVVLREFQLSLPEVSADALLSRYNLTN